MQYSCNTDWKQPLEMLMCLLRSHVMRLIPVITNLLLQNYYIQITEFLNML